MRRKIGRIILWVGLLLVLAEGVLFASIIIMGNQLDAPQPADTIIVLGAGIDMDGKPRPMLQYRLDRALELYEAGYAATLIMTGAQGDDEPMPEAYAMRDALVAQGVAPDVIFCDPDSYNTQENIENAKRIMEAEGLQSAIIVTNGYHLWRALRIAEDLGIPASGGAANNANSVYYAIQYTLRETLSWMKYWVTS